ncbi:MAG: hypothetical protein U1F98_14765 [Verrucomicrobiota bacterium]
MNTLLIILFAAVISGCGTLPPQYSAAPTRCLVKGVSDGNSTVQICTVDGGQPILINDHEIGDKVWLEPGAHKIGVTCTTKMSWGTIMKGADVELDAKLGNTYLLKASPVKSVSDTPHVEVIVKKAP